MRWIAKAGTTFSKIVLSSINATNASGSVAKFTGSREDLRLNESAALSAAGSGHYGAVAILPGR